MIKSTIKHLRDLEKKISLWTKIVILGLSSFLPVIARATTANAAQLTSRSVSISTSKSAQTGVTYGFGFTLPSTSATAVQSMIFEFCTAPLGACTLPTGMVVNAGTVANGTQTGFPTNTTAFSTEQTTALGDCSGITNATTDTKYCVKRTEPTTTTGGAVTFQVTGVTNPTTATHITAYVRISVYSDNAFTSGALLHTGVVAAAITQQLTVNAKVQERLDFCVGSTAINDGITSPGTDCTTISGNTVDLGVVDSSTVNITPVAVGGGGNNTNGIAMVRSNAFNGTVISYFSEQNTSSGALKVAGATCTPPSTTDQCFNSNAAQSAFVSGTEAFGLTVSAVNTGSTTGYVGANLVRDPAYDGDGTAGVGFAWQTTGALAPLASSSSAATKVLDDEALILRFAATASVTTPTGQYTVTSTYIATATF